MLPLPHGSFVALVRLRSASAFPRATTLASPLDPPQLSLLACKIRGNTAGQGREAGSFPRTPRTRA